MQASSFHYACNPQLIPEGKILKNKTSSYTNIVSSLMASIIHFCASVTLAQKCGFTQEIVISHPQTQGRLQGWWRLGEGQTEGHVWACPPVLLLMLSEWPKGAERSWVPPCPMACSSPSIYPPTAGSTRPAGQTSGWPQCFSNPSRREIGERLEAEELPPPPPGTLTGQEGGASGLPSSSGTTHIAWFHYQV